MLIENQTINAGAEEQIKSLVSAKQFAEANPDMVSVAGKRV
ncbi:MAG TPA: hypothetical protein P5052_01855 [Candidatus Paceibacterota bacterium]|nr:hypothetical protein [Candidatus Paceibacterota bacterium]HRZ29503.1 hypothetical protein [Candidatus Paceibacterota bacterium]